MPKSKTREARHPYRRGRHVCVAVVLIVVLSSSLASAQSEQGLTGQSPTDGSTDPAVGLEVRAELSRFLDNWIRLSTELGVEEAADTFRTSAQYLAIASDEELSQLGTALPEIAWLGQSSSQIATALANSTSGHLSTEAADAASLALPGAPYSSCGPNRPDAEAFLVARLATFIAEQTRESASRFCNQIAVVACFGANTSILCVITDLVYIGVKIVQDGMAKCVDDINRAEIEGSYDRLEFIFTALASFDVRTTDGIAALSAAIGSHDSNLALHDSRIVTALEGHTNRIADRITAHEVAVQTQLASVEEGLEERLRKVQDSIIDLAVTSGKSTPTLYTPRCQNPDGLLDDLRKRLVVAMCDYQALGEKAASLNVATNELEAGDGHLGIVTPPISDLCPPTTSLTIGCSVPGSFVAAASDYLEGMKALTK